MNKLALLLTTLLVVIGGFFYWTRVAGAEIGNLNIYEGTASLLRGTETLSGRTGSGVQRNDVVKVGGSSRVSIVLKDGSVIRLEAGSEVQILKLVYDGDTIEDASFKLISGKMWSKVEPLENNANWQVETPTTVASVRGTSFNTRYSDASTGVSVYLGKVGIALLMDRENEKLLNWGDSFKLGDTTLAEDFAKDPVPLDPLKFDDWVLFNLSEDAKLDGETFTPQSAATSSDVMMEEEKGNVAAPAVAEPMKAELKAAPKKEEPKITERKISSLLLYGNKSSILVGEETKLKVRATYSDGSTEEMPFEKIKWEHNANLGRIYPPGYYSSGRPTGIEVVAVVNGARSNSVSIIVKESLKILKRIEVTFDKKAAESRYSQSDYATNYDYKSPLPTFQFTATAFYDDGSSKNVTSQSTWSVEGSAGGKVDSIGHYTPANEGSAEVSAKFENRSASTNVTIP